MNAELRTTLIEGKESKKSPGKKSPKRRLIERSIQLDVLFHWFAPSVCTSPYAIFNLPASSLPLFKLFLPLLRPRVNPFSAIRTDLPKVGNRKKRTRQTQPTSKDDSQYIGIRLQRQSKVNGSIRENRAVNRYRTSVLLVTRIVSLKRGSRTTRIRLRVKGNLFFKLIDRTLTNRWPFFGQYQLRTSCSIH